MACLDRRRWDSMGRDIDIVSNGEIHIGVDGYTISGTAGVLIADGPIQVWVRSFKPNSYKAQENLHDHVEHEKITTTDKENLNGHRAHKRKHHREQEWLRGQTGPGPSS
ncbi:hypothetical protein L484_012798 [Morus notabilis]|uniref:Uncharacterized protein n=1 Tax=Morus notabilis TaxID=981085 RepID=W9SZ58_9ROSA|nr:hypothetical protein L484_012798 [Morus notabilis]